MEIKYDIEDDLVKCFSTTAKECLIEQTKKYTLDIIKEAETDEELYQVQGAEKEITQSNVLQAVKTYKVLRKKSCWIKLLRAFGEALIFIAGIMFLPERFVTADGKLDLVYGIIWLVVTLIAIIIIVCNHFLGGD